MRILPLIVLCTAACSGDGSGDTCGPEKDCGPGSETTPPTGTATGITNVTTSTDTGFGTTPTGPIAPTELDDLSRYLFQHVDDPDEARAGLVELQQILDGNIPADPTDFSVTISALEGTYLDGIAPPAGTYPTDQVATALPHLDEGTVAQLAESVTMANQVCLMERQIIWAERTFLTDQNCFMDQSCDTLRTSTEARLESMLDENWLTLEASWSWVRLTGDTGPIDALVGRTWTEQIFVADSGNSSWRQYYMLDAWVPNPDDTSKTIRWRAWWSDREINSISLDVFKSIMITDMDEALTYQQEWGTTGTATSCPNDVNLPRP